MKKIKHYFIAARADRYELSLVIEDDIKMGWQPFGGISCSSFIVGDNPKEQRDWYCQAMVKYED